jgi:hypothetical protein
MRADDAEAAYKLGNALRHKQSFRHLLRGNARKRFDGIDVGDGARLAPY